MWSSPLTDRAGNQTQETRDFTIDKTAPAITVTSPANGATVSTAPIDIHGTVSDPAANVTVNGAAASVSGSDFTANGIALVAGDNAFAIIAQDAVGNRSEVTTVVTYTPPAPVAGLIASPTAIQAGQSATLEWSTENATTVSIDNGIGTVVLSGSLVVSPTATTSYTLTATGPGGFATAQVDISVTQVAAVTSITASSTTIQLGESVTLTWSAANATAAVINQGIGLVPLSGSLAVTPTSTTEYAITASGPDGPSGPPWSSQFLVQRSRSRREALGRSTRT